MTEEADVDSDPTPAAPVASRMPATSTDSRQKLQGLKQRRKTNEEKTRQIKAAEASLAEETRRRQKAEDQALLLNQRIRQLEAQVEAKDKKLEEGDQWLTSTYTLMSTSGKKDLKQSMIMAKDTFPPGR